ncbi:enoyl-CoA hydratase [Mycolicibacterium litorale]|nr:enoyl-CoA hydratase [Mycolicibacterium litorale]
MTWPLYSGRMIGVTRDGHVLTLEMQRAERRNALNGELVDGLREAIEKAATEDVRAIVLTGQGHVFSSGADLSGGQGVADELPDKARALNFAIDRAPVPVIAAVNGPAIGAGVILSMICDLRVVAPEAYFQFPVAKYGIALDNWSIRRLTSLVGAGRARGMLLAAERLTSEVALQTGMANRIGTLDDAQAWAQEIAGFAPLALQHAKRVLNDDGAYEDPWPAHQELFDRAWASQDIIEAQVARIEKRPPRFKGA